jgi:hypothetical protein
MVDVLRLVALPVVCAITLSCGSAFTAAPASDAGSDDAADGAIADAKDGARLEAMAEATAETTTSGPIIPCGRTSCSLATHTCCINTNTLTFVCEIGSKCIRPNDLAVHCESARDHASPVA